MDASYPNLWTSQRFMLLLSSSRSKFLSSKQILAMNTAYTTIHNLSIIHTTPSLWTMWTELQKEPKPCYTYFRHHTPNLLLLWLLVLVSQTPNIYFLLVSQSPKIGSTHQNFQLISIFQTLLLWPAYHKKD